MRSPSASALDDSIAWASSLTGLHIIRGAAEKTFTLGWFVNVGRKRQGFRDTRFAPKMSWFEAVWLLKNEAQSIEVARKFGAHAAERFWR